MQYYGVPGWACGSDGGLKAFAEYLRSSNGSVAAGPELRPIRLQRLLIWADRGQAGESAGWHLHRVACELGIAAEMYLPAGSDDFADDLAKGLPPSTPATDVPAAVGALPLRASPQMPDGHFAYVAPPEAAGAAAPKLSISEVSTRIMALQKGLMGDQLCEVAQLIAAAELDPATEDQCINLLWKRTGVKKKAAEEIVRRARAGMCGTTATATAQRSWLAKIAKNESGEPKGIMSNIAIVCAKPTNGSAASCSTNSPA